MNNKEFMKRVVYAIALLLVFSCSNELSHEVKTTEESKIELALEKVSAMGFDTEGYQIIDNDIVVEGDIVLNIDDILSDSSRQYYFTGRLVADNNIANVKISNSIGSSWNNAFNSAIAEWNSVSNTKIRLLNKDYRNIPFTSSNSDIDIFYDSSKFSTGSNISGLGSSPDSSGRPGRTINVNLGNSYVAGFNDNQKKKLIMHEIGHCLGFAHQVANGTSEPGTSYVPGTPMHGSDIRSIMAQDNYSYFYSRDPKFTDGDKKAMQTLYPLTSNTPYIDVFRHSDFDGYNYRLFESCPQLPFNNTLSSIKFYNGAHIYVYDDPNYGGKNYGYVGGPVDYRGHSFNDKASSIKFAAYQHTGTTIVNNTFSSSSRDWAKSYMYHYSKPEKLFASYFSLNGKCEAYISGGVLHTYISDRGTKPEDIYFKTTDFILDNRFTYEVSFKARTEQGQRRSIKVVVGDGLDLDAFEEREFRIDGEMDTYSFTFRSSKFTSDGVLAIYMGDMPLDSWSKDVVLDDIKITKR